VSPARDERPVALTHPERVLWPEVGWTKRQMVDYYEAVAAVLLPHLRGRPLTLGRWPEGVDGKGWYQTNCRGAPSWLRTAEIPASRGGKSYRMCVVDDADALRWVANQGTVELHPYLSAADAFDEPLALVFDLDPGPPAGLVECCRVALLVRDGLRAGDAAGNAVDQAAAAGDRPIAVKTSGGGGLHLYLPTAPGATFVETRDRARRLAATLRAGRPELVVDGFTHAERSGRVLIDWRQNERARSQIAPYSLRAAPWPLASTPLEWAEVEAAAAGGDARPLYFAPDQALARVARWGDLFAGALARPTIGA
jgi:bifunctional non-homologous end joining protein LigD